jgi:NTP pyrophosphatase (non-canonical NTP hydrolase)
MKVNEYQELALRTAPMFESPNDINYASLGLTGEAGEFSEVVKKVIYHGHPMDKTRLIKELGDIQWYVAYAASTLGVSLEEVMQVNIDKLKARYPDGFNQEKSINRASGDT